VRHARFVLPCLVLLAACGSSTAASNKFPPGTINVVAAENTWGNIAEQIGGSHARVTSMINDPNLDPHQFESSVAEAAALADARVVVINGLGYDDFIKPLLANTSNGVRTVLTVATVLGATGSETNPHLWYDIPKVPTVAAAIAQQFTTANPTAAAAFAANLKTFDAALQPVLTTISMIAAKYPHAPVAYTERVPQYLVQAAGLDDRTPSGFAQAIEDGTEPSPAATQAMNDLLTNHRIKALLYNAQAESQVTRHVRDLARANGIPVVAVTETLPRSEPNFQSWQLHQVQALASALGGTA
jgi:zinc/manganese transport system substrate-binding protein